MSEIVPGFSTNPKLEFIYVTGGNGGLYGRFAMLERDFAYIDQQGRKHIAPKGMKTDGGSIPRFFWRIVGSPFTYCLPAYIIHDHYCSRARDIQDKKQMKQLRKEADVLFNEMLLWLHENVKGIHCPTWKRRLMYHGVRLGAWFDRPHRVG